MEFSTSVSRLFFVFVLIIRLFFRLPFHTHFSFVPHSFALRLVDIIRIVNKKKGAL
jgi:hypothetical protein